MLFKIKTLVIIEKEDPHELILRKNRIKGLLNAVNAMGSLGVLVYLYLDGFVSIPTNEDIANEGYFGPSSWLLYVLAANAVWSFYHLSKEFKTLAGARTIFNRRRDEMLVHGKFKGKMSDVTGIEIKERLDWSGGSSKPNTDLYILRENAKKIKFLRHNDYDMVMDVAYRIAGFLEVEVRATKE